jgi:hypothetical protein
VQKWPVAVQLSGAKLAAALLPVSGKAGFGETAFAENS